MVNKEILFLTPFFNVACALVVRFCFHHLFVLFLLEDKGAFV